ncbi:MAG: hypothetical protein J6S83_05945 [Lachnospiraceae bacterium]|nr:hypothetical protein [Lachnospiraceae bacterium]
MSQAKVDRYKEEKKNRKQIMAKEKREWAMIKAGGGILAALVVAWIGFSVYQTINAPKEPENTPIVVTDYTVNTDALNDYISSLNAD